MTLDLETVFLQKGAHKNADEGGCLMEWVSYLAGEPWSDHPMCVSPVLAAFCRRWQDDLSDADRQMLKPYIPRLIGTNTGVAADERRAWMLTDWMVRVYLPAWLRCAKLNDQADAVSALAELVNPESWTAAKAIIETAKQKSAAAWDAARAAAWDAARAAAWAATWDATRAATWDAARDAARAAARAAAWDAAWAAAGDAAGDALKPTVIGLQQSALQLLDRLIEVK